MTAVCAVHSFRHFQNMHSLLQLDQRICYTVRTVRVNALFLSLFTCIGHSVQISSYSSLVTGKTRCNLSFLISKQRLIRHFSKSPDNHRPWFWPRIRVCNLEQSRSIRFETPALARISQRRGTATFSPLWLYERPWRWWWWWWYVVGGE